ncbi:histidine phosphatase family protein [Candidatus Micrarchaeota archaeon]|nr:histidine phosphatase family protein [Candidatus Micrarchaeota archaeon]MBU1930490.1 histidine phosphatase family protein [Candidatus Micrarchaeota archaeon]
MKLLLVRHGETIENQKGIMQGHLPGKLSTKGIEEAEKLAQKLKNEKIAAIFSSDLTRAKETTQTIARFHPKTPVFFVTELREADAGSLTGKSGKNIDWVNRPKELESRESMRERARKIIQQALQQFPHETVLFIGHNGISKALITIIQQEPATHMEKIPNIPTGTVSTFEIQKKPIELK